MKAKALKIAYFFCLVTCPILFIATLGIINDLHYFIIDPRGEPIAYLPALYALYAGFHHKPTSQAILDSVTNKLVVIIAICSIAIITTTVSQMGHMTNIMSIAYHIATLVFLVFIVITISWLIKVRTVLIAYSLIATSLVFASPYMSSKVDEINPIIIPTLTSQTPKEKFLSIANEQYKADNEEFIRTREKILPK
jgi:hypothetical protein